MALPAVQVDEHSLYPWHEEIDVPRGSEHLDQCSYWKHALKRYHPVWRVESDLCLYWERHNIRRFRAADLAVIDGPTSVPAANYLAWCDGPLLLVAEVSSEESRARDLGVKFKVYRDQLRALEYLLLDGSVPQARLWQLREGTYVEVEPDSEGRLWSSQLGLWFVLEPSGLLRAYTPEGERLLTHQEEGERADPEAQRADLEARLRKESEENLAEKDRQLADALAEIAKLRKLG